MNPEQVQQHIDRICWGAEYVKVVNGFGREMVLILRSLSLADKNWCSFIYEEAIKDGTEQGLFSEFDLSSHYKKIGAWSEKEESKIKGLEADIANLEEGMIEAQKDKKLVRQIVSFRNAARHALNRLRNEKAQKFGFTLEKYALERKVAAIIFCSTHNLDTSKYWKSWQDFEDEQDVKLVSNLTEAYLNRTHLGQKEIREIARSNLWRFKWTGAKNCGQLFGVPVVELDQEQEAILYWSQVYDAAYEAYERPSQEVIDNDELLDKWFADQSKKQKTKDVIAGKSKGRFGVSEGVGKHSEVMIVTNKDINPDAPEPEEVWSLNSDAMRTYIGRQSDHLKQVKTIREQDLRPDRNTRMLAGAKRAEFEVRQGRKKVTKLQDY